MEIAVRRQGRCGRITLCRPEALNALTHAMIGAMAEALEAWRDDAAVELVAIDGAGGKAFCAGGDILSLYERGRAGDLDYGRRFWRDEYRLNAAIAAYPKPFVALMDGIVMGGGVGVAAHGSHRAVTERTVVAMPEVSIGFLPDVGGSLLLARAPGRLGEYLATTAARMGPGDAIHAGFADLFVPAQDIEALTAELAERGLAALRRYEATPPEGTLAALQAEIDAVFGAADAQAIVALLAVRDAPWVRAAREAVLRHAPLSVACALEAVRQARGMDRLEDCLAMEYRFAWRATEEADFLEGIRAAIIDRDHRPAWRHGSLEAVRPAEVAAMLAPLGEHELQLPGGSP
jgi:enoyl-CoA hydratase